MSDKPNDLTTISPAHPTLESKPPSKSSDKSPRVDASETVKLTHDAPGAVRGAFTLNRYKPDDKGVIAVDVRDAETLRQKWGWYDA